MAYFSFLQKSGVRRTIGPVRLYVQFVAGTGSLMMDALKDQLDALQQLYADDSAMVLDSMSSPDKAAAVPFFKNAFVVIAETDRGSIEEGVVQLSRILAKKRLPKLPGRIDRFRLMAHIDGSLVPMEVRAKTLLERAITQRTGGRVEPGGQCQEYWVVGRQDLPKLLLCARLPKVRRPAKGKGSISQELSAMLVAASRPRPRDVFLDPFAGSGSFIAARLEQPLKRAWYVDRELAMHRESLGRQLLSDPRVRMLDEDGLALPSIPDGSIDVVVTDPPWGEHQALGQPFEAFARDIGKSFARVLHPTRGRYVLLVNRRNASPMRECLAAADLAPNSEHPILVNGHPASVLIGERAAVTAVPVTGQAHDPLADHSRVTDELAARG
jgi:Putative RNA methylase family UPF0020